MKNIMFKELLELAKTEKQKNVVAEKAMRQFYQYCLEELERGNTKVSLKSGDYFYILTKDMKKVDKTNIGMVKAQIKEQLLFSSDYQFDEVKRRNIVIMADLVCN